MTDIEQDVTEDAPGVHLFAKLGLSIESLAAQVRRSNTLEQQRLSRLPNLISIERASVPGAATTDVIDFGSPQPGRTWIVRLLMAIANPVAANAAVVTWYVGQNVGGNAPGMLPGTMARWQFPSVPGFQTFTSNVIQLLPQQHLLAGLTGIPGGSNISLAAVVNEQLFYAQSTAVAVE
jgi:hypothetical protein